MTKQVRIENACLSNYKIDIEVWERYPDGDKLVDTLYADYPTRQLETYITSTRYLIIKERNEPN